MQAETSEQIAFVRELMLEYAQWLKFNLCFQGFDEELRSLPGRYAPPGGRLLLALWNDQVAGMGAFRPMTEAGVCEMKRLYVRGGFRGHAIGNALAEALIHSARGCGYSAMRLDTIPRKMDSAISLYRRLGFYEVAPYYETPMAHTLFMQLDLVHGAGAGSAEAKAKANL